MTRLTQSLAMGVGSSGAMTDVSSYVDLEAGVSRSWGRQSEFDDVAPGTFSFTLDNADGRFTPGNTASALATTVTEGMQVCWNLTNGTDTRLVAGTVQAIEPVFPSGESAWAQVKVTCDDMLGNAGRRTLGVIPDSLFDAAVGYGLWPLNDALGSGNPTRTRGSMTQNLVAKDLVHYGVSNSHIPVDDTVATVNADAAGSIYLQDYTPPATYTTPLTAGGWGLWMERTTDASVFQCATRFSSGGTAYIEMWASNAATWLVPGTGTNITTSPLPYGTAHYLSYKTTIVLSPAAVIVEFFIDGVSVGTSNYTGGSIGFGRQQFGVNPSWAASLVGTCHVARISHSPAPINEYAVVASSTAVRLTTIASCVPEITLDTLPTLSTATLGALVSSGGSALDELNAAMRAEQGSIYTAATGTLTSPTQKVKVRSSDRTTTALYAFDAETEASGATEFIRDLTNLVSQATATGPSAEATYRDLTLTRAGSKNTSDEVPYRDYPDLYTWASDRVWRGSNVALRAASVTVDAFTTPSDRSDDLMALVPGDRIQLTGLPSTQLGFSTWDGWVLGGEENHTVESHEFTIYLQPVLPETAIFDTHRFMAGGDLSLSAGINSSVTSISVATTNATFTVAGGDFPVDIIIGTEEMTVSACTSATPQVMTVTRGVNGTTAAAHSSGDLVELATDSLFAF